MPSMAWPLRSPPQARREEPACLPACTAGRLPLAILWPLEASVIKQVFKSMDRVDRYLAASSLVIIFKIQNFFLFVYLAIAKQKSPHTCRTPLRELKLVSRDKDYNNTGFLGVLEILENIIKTACHTF